MEEMRREFSQAVRLFEALGNVKLHSGCSLREELRFNGPVSLWEALSVFTVLYRLPLIFRARTTQVNNTYWPLRGITGHVFNSMRRFIFRCQHRFAAASFVEKGASVMFFDASTLFFRDVLAPVARAVRRSGVGDVIVLGLNEDHMLHGCRQTEWEYKHVLEYCDIYVSSNVKLQQRRLRVIYDEIVSRLSGILDEIGVDVQGYSFLKRELQWLFWRGLPEGALFVALAMEIFSRRRPEILVSADDADHRCRAFSLSARALGIPVLIVQQGLTAREYPEWQFFSGDALAAMGEESREIMAAQGIAPDRVIVTGNPAFDKCVARDGVERARVRAALEIEPQRKVVLFASQPNVLGAFKSREARCEMVLSIMNSMRRRPDLLLIVKPHPNEVERESRKILASVQNAIVAPRGCDIVDLIVACDVFVTFFSQTGLQALLAGKPVINVLFPGAVTEPGYAVRGATWVARNEGEIDELLKVLTSEQWSTVNESRRKLKESLLANVVHITDGRAAERVARVILEMKRPK